MGQSGRSTLRGNYQKRKAGQDDEQGRDDVKRQIDSDLSNSKQIYQLVNVKTGGGKLVDIIKSLARHQSLHSSSASFADDGARGDAENGLKSKRPPTTADPRSIQEYDQAVDEQIRSLVEPLLYNHGRGKLVPLSYIWRFRFGNTQDLKMDANSEDSPPLPDEIGQLPSTGSFANDAGHRWVCWKLEERGFVGETALHICFLLSTPTHMILAKRLLNLFPMLINDIYTCDEYFGESSLHMAIVNEDVRILKLLLDHGANVHERCLGSFFLPNDQKDKANNGLRQRLLGQASSGLDSGSSSSSSSSSSPLSFEALQSNQFSDLQTNYEGYTYWGEYPLSFAASLGLADCYKLLLAKGASPNRCDSNGNSTLHICVIANRIDMFDLCYSNGANLSLHNKLGFSPLTLAAKLRRVEMFFHILTILRQVNWIFCNVGFVETPLDEIDSINTSDGSCNDQSVLSIVVSGNSNEHLQMLNGLLSDLLQVKWETSVRGIFRSWLALFIIFLAIVGVAYLTRLDIRAASKWIETFEVSMAAVVSNQSSDASASLRQDRATLIRNAATDYKLANQYSELLVVCCVVYYLLTLMHRCLIESATADWQPKRSFPPEVDNQPSTVSPRPKRTASKLTQGLMRILVQAPELIIFTLNCVLVLACIPLRFVFDWRDAEDFLVTIIMFLMPLKLLFFCRGSKSIGSFIVMIYKILVNDVLCFVVFLIIFIAGFSQSFIVIFKTYQPTSTGNNATNSASFFESLVRGDESYFLNFYDSFIMLHMMALNEFSWVVDEFKSTEYPILARTLFCVYMVLVSILLVNMLIAMLGKTYQDIASQPNENLRQWARALLTVERMCSRKTRLGMLDRYSTENRHREPSVVKLDKWISRMSSSQAAPCHRYYSSTWALSERDSRDISTIEQLKREHQLSSERLAKPRH